MRPDPSWHHIAIDTTGGSMMPTETIPTKDELLEQYAARHTAPREFVQYDSFNPPTFPVGPGSEDGDGDESWGPSRTYELMHGATVRVLIHPDAPPEMASRMLRKIADWIDRDGYAKGEPSDTVRVVPSRRSGEGSA